MATTKVYLVPLIFSFLLPGTVILTYIIAVSLGHVPACFPYISDTGTFAPESCIFGQSLNLLGLLNFVFAWTRYSHVKLKCGTDLKFSLVLCLNKLGFWLAVVASIGSSMVGNFQETGILALHCIGASLLFVPSLLYTWIQAAISLWTTDVLSSRMMAWFRLVLGVLGALIMAIEMISTPISFYFFHGDDFRHWKPEDGGFEFHVASTVCEWLLCLGYGLFVMTFVGEFREIQIDTPEIRLLNEEERQQKKATGKPF